MSKDYQLLRDKMSPEAREKAKLKADELRNGMGELKPCPFCGSEATELFGNVFCSKFNNCMGSHLKIDAWNTRADPWIPITDEKKPEDRLHCIISRDGEVIDGVTYCGKYDHFRSLFFTISAKDVQAYQPLPPPYTGESK